MPEGVTIPGNTLAELRRDMDRLRFVTQQIKEMRRPAPSAWLRHPASNATPCAECVPQAVRKLRAENHR